MFENFGLKDLVTFLFSLAALIISGISLKITRDRDTRETESKKPALDVVLPILDGTGPWEISVELRNRSDNPIYLKHMALQDPTLSFPHTDKGRLAFFKTEDGKEIGGTCRAFNVNIAAGQTYSSIIKLERMADRRVGNNQEVVFYAEYIEKGSTETTKIISVRRIANP